MTKTENTVEEKDEEVSNILDFNSFNPGTVKEGDQIPIGNGQSLRIDKVTEHRAEDTVKKSQKEINKTTLSINDVIPLDSKAFSAKMREMVIVALATYGEWIDYNRLESSVHNNLRGQYRKKIARGARDGMFAIGYWQTGAGNKRKIICLEEKDPQIDVALKIYKESQHKKIDGEISREINLIERRKKEIDDAYKEIKSRPESMDIEIRNFETLILRMIDERDRLVKLFIEAQEKKEKIDMTGYVDRLEKTIESLEGTDIKSSPIEENKSVMGDLEKEIDKVNESYKDKPEGMRMQTGKAVKKKGFLSKLFS